MGKIKVSLRRVTLPTFDVTYKGGCSSAISLALNAMFLEFVVAAFALFLGLAGKDLHRLFKILIHPLFSPLRSLRSPPSNGFFRGNRSDVENADPSILHEKWVQEYGPVFNFKIAMGVRPYQFPCLVSFVNGSEIYA
jgi:hypothetical protein